MKLLLLSLCLTCAALPASARDLLVFAAASLQGALDKAIDQFGGGVTVSYGGSSALARQITHGAPADIFISAAVIWVDKLEEGGHLKAGTRRDLLRNRLVLVAHDPDFPPVPLDPPPDLPALLDGGVLAMAYVEAVPAGIYGKAALQSLGIWQDVQGRIAQTDTVRAALRLVDRGDAPLGIVYETDVAASSVKIVAEFPEETHPAIIYPAAVTVQSTHAKALEFLNFLSSPEGGKPFVDEGFTVIE